MVTKDTLIPLNYEGRDRAVLSRVGTMIAGFSIACFVIQIIAGSVIVSLIIFSDTHVPSKIIRFWRYLSISTLFLFVVAMFFGKPRSMLLRILALLGIIVCALAAFAMPTGLNWN